MKEKPQSHLLVSSLVTLVAVVGLVLVFATHQPTGAFVEIKGDLTRTRYYDPYLTPCLDVNNPKCHKDNCRLAPSDPNYNICGKCPAGSEENPQGLTGNCCVNHLQQSHCETWKEFYDWGNTRRTVTKLTSPTQKVTLG